MPEVARARLVRCLSVFADDEMDRSARCQGEEGHGEGDRVFLPHNGWLDDETNVVWTDEEET